jgi:hypothetical protein
MHPIIIHQIARARTDELAREAERRRLAAAATPGRRPAAAGLWLAARRWAGTSSRTWAAAPRRDRQPGQFGEHSPRLDVTEGALLPERLGSPR